MSEKAIKALQKEVLHTFEEELLEELSPVHFNELRKLVFRSTFLAYRLGVIGPEKDDASLRKLTSLASTMCFHPEISPLQELDIQTRSELMSFCLEIWLEAFRIGAISSAGRT